MDNGAEYYHRILKGENEAITDIIQDYGKGLVLFISNFVDDFGDAEEIADDIYIKLCTKKPKFSGKSTFKTWLYAIGRNAAINSIKKKKRHHEDFHDDLDNVTDKANIETNYIKDEEKIYIHKAMEKINTDYRQVLWLVFFDEFSITETAKIMHKSEKQISNLLYRAKESLRKVFEKEGFKYEGI